MGVATALAATVAVAAWHHTAFTHSSWTSIVRQPKIAARRTPPPVERRVQTARVMPPAPADQPMREARSTWIPDGMSTVEVARSGRIAGAPALTARRERLPAGMTDAHIGRSTRLALAEPALPESLGRALKAAEPRVPAPNARPEIAEAPIPAPAPEQAAKIEIAELTPPPLVTLPSENIPLPALPKRPVAVAAARPEPLPEPDIAKAMPEVAAAMPSVAATELPTRGPLPAPRPARHRTKGSVPVSPRYQLAYASPDTVNEGSDSSNGGLFGRLFGSHQSALSSVGRRVAVYSIKDATVYMPNGKKLEAHSGMGRMTDNPHYANRKMHGPTPPNVYNLTMRKHLFHGVRAVRMLPTDRGAMHGRDGMLAHTYMLRGRPGQSNGCVVFKNYARFLKAFQAGHISKMIVVAKLSDLPREVASR